MELSLLQKITKIYKNGIHTKLQDDMIFKEYYRDDEIILRAVELSERIVDKMTAIKVAARLIGEPSPDGFVYILRLLPIGSEPRKIVTKDIYNDKINVPTFMWRFRGKNSVDSFIMECEHDYTLKYPIKRTSISQTDGGGLLIYETDGSLVADEYLIHSEDEFLDHLDQVLVNI